MKLKQHFIAFATLIIIASATSCNKDCFDQGLQDQFQTIDCTADCPGVTGCDGNFYCNECIANQQGIRVE
jgi:hypothetical protein